jgi:hypothetical protein
MKILKRLFKRDKWVTVTSVTEVRENDIRYMEIYENGKTSVIAL